MKPMDIIIIVIICVLVGLSIKNMIKRKKMGCSCGCRECSERGCESKTKK